MSFTLGTNREFISPDQAADLRRAGALVEDPRRQRPRWFDGRFLAARDLIREQQYFLTRESDLGQAAGSGVAVGLEVGEGMEAGTLVISSGHGVTPSGQLAMLPDNIVLRLTDIPLAEQLSAKFGLGRLPVPPTNSRTGLFVLALRPVEFTANPTDAYPTSLTGQRSVEDGDIIEATAIVLVPWQDDGGGDGLEARRSQAARAIFVDGVARGVAANLLPVAMLALTGNTLVWVDAPMVRRELGADRSDLPGLDIAPRALRLAYLMQHQSHLAELLTRNGRGAPASSWFSALPPAGPLPPNLINPADFTQSYFPAPVDVDFSIIPEDELPALLEESLALPPIDLLADADTLDSTAVLVLAPVPRNQWRAVISRLESLTRRIKPAAPNQVSARKPLEILQRLKLPVVLATPLDPTSPSDAEWQRLARLPNLWYVRRRNLAYREDVAGSALRLAGREVALEADFLIKLNTLGLKKTLDAALKRATPAAQNEIKNLLSSPKFADSAALTAVTLGELTRAATLDQSAVLQAASAVTEADSGAGLARLENATDIGSNAAALAKLTADADWKSLDVSAKKSAADNVSELVANIGAKPVVNTAFTPVSRLVLNRPK